VDLRVALPDGPLTVVADPAQLEQVLVNLCTNARDAMPRGGRLTLAAAAAGLDAAQSAARGLPGPGPWVRLTVADTGEGIRTEDLPRVFEPFFTTKSVGRGTGLGLAIVDGIVRQHGGHVAVESRPGQGTTFSILLPASEEAPQAAAGEAAAALGPRGSETILLAEDEPAVRRVLQTTLERAGYRVVAVEDGAQAVARFRARPAGIDLCLLDVIMPVMNGREAFDAIRLVDPGARVLYVSGYTADLLERRGVAEGLPAVVPKPVSPADLLARVRAELDRPRPAG
jgi:CheY-like chemotaxis protein